MNSAQKQIHAEIGDEKFRCFPKEIEKTAFSLAPYIIIQYLCTRKSIQFVRNANVFVMQLARKRLNIINE